MTHSTAEQMKDSQGWINWLFSKGSGKTNLDSGALNLESRAFSITSFVS